MELSNIYIYPIKSLGGIEMKEAIVENRGLQYDRRWMLVTPDGQFITQRKYPVLALLKTKIEGNHLVVFQQENKTTKLTIPLAYSGDGAVMEVKIWKDICQGLRYDSAVDDWFSRYLGMPCYLVYMPDTVQRKTDPRFVSAGQYVSYADGYPFLIIGQATLDHLNQKLDSPLLMNRFRPNFVFNGSTAHIEDSWQDFTIGSVSFRGVKPCSRCNLPTINQQTAEVGTEPLETLSSYRRINRKILFGQNLIWVGQKEDIEVIVRVGDEVKP